MTDKKEKTPAECPKCGYTWQTKAQSKRITCPECFTNRAKEEFLTDSAKVKIGLKGGKDREKIIAETIEQTILNQYPELDVMDVISLEETIKKYKQKIKEKQREIAEELAHEIVRKCQKEYMNRKNIEKSKIEAKEEKEAKEDSMTDEEVAEKLEERRKVSLE